MEGVVRLGGIPTLYTYMSFKASAEVNQGKATNCGKVYLGFRIVACFGVSTIRVHLKLLRSH